MANPRFDGNSKRLCRWFEGQLSKYTNVMKGWQFRWFVLDPDKGLLLYYLNQTERSHRPRGFLHLAAAVISPSDEDSNTFTVSSANGLVFKLRATDARERHDWISRIRAIAEMHTMAIAQSNPPLPPRELPSHTSHPSAQSSESAHSLSTVTFGSSTRPFLAVRDALASANKYIQKADKSSNEITRTVEALPDTGRIKYYDRDLLLLKATSLRTVKTLRECLSILEQQQLAPAPPPPPPPPPLPAHSSLDHSSICGIKKGTSIVTPPDFDSNQDSAVSHSSTGAIKKHVTVVAPPDYDPGKDSKEYRKSSQHEFSAVWPEPMPVSPPLSLLSTSEDRARVTLQDDETDEDVEDSSLVPFEEHRSIIVHLLSQLKLGMDLTRVVLPTFILERRSLLEMFADCMGHPQLFICIPDEATPYSRMLALVEWYLTSFHVGRSDSIAKKPYNPIIGETFHCSWRVNTMANASLKTNAANGIDENFLQSENGVQDASENGFEITYTAEQVSHHPPVTAFYVECASKKMFLNASIWTKSNFSGMSVGVNMVGDLSLNLLTHGEQYDFTLPSAYARSIISVPWVELGGKATINCPVTGYCATIMFHTKPFYGGKVHQVTGEVKDNGGVIVCKLQGEWNSHYEFLFPSGETKLIHVKEIPTYKKRVKALSEQGEFESRKLWYNVTKALKMGDIEAATDYKCMLEAQQRDEERARKEAGIEYPTVYFHKLGDNWIFNNPLHEE